MRHILPLILVSLVDLSLGKAFNEGELQVADRRKREFSVFTVITFQNVGCSFVDDAPNTGTCFSSTECTEAGGTADGNCASGFGVCCRIVVSASASTVTQNCSYIQNPTFPTTQASIGTTTTMFTYMIDTPTDICQLRLDFANFVTSQPIGTGSCLIRDNLAITSPTGGTLPPMCGTNSGQHMYVETGRSATNTMLEFSFNILPPNAADVTRTWNIKVSMLACNTIFKAPTDCLQYFTANVDTVTSYNFAAGNIPTDTAYLTCVRKNEGMCAIQWAQSPNVPNAFNVQATAPGASIAPSSCNIAYVQIPGTVTSLNIHCGGTFTNGEEANTNPETLISREIPFTLHTTVSIVPITLSRGYSLVYSQIGC